MLNVKTPAEVIELIHQEFAPCMEAEKTDLFHAIGRILSEDMKAMEYVPDFNRSTMDGYAVRASDTFGCSDSIPAILTVTGQVLMGESTDEKVQSFTCVKVPTGGAVPEGADAVVMQEYTEDYGDGTVGIIKSVAPGDNIIFRGDDVSPGQVILRRGRKLRVSDIGALAAMGYAQVPVVKKIRVGILSTGDELIPAEKQPLPGQIRDVNSYLLAAAVEKAVGVPVFYGIVEDDQELVLERVRKAAQECDLVLLSGGTSVGEKDAVYQVLKSLGTVLFHGIAMKPGKPAILGKIGKVPIFGLPGHPVAVHFVMELFVTPLMDVMAGCKKECYNITALLTESVSANHGRAQYMAVVLTEEAGVWYAKPVRSKSGLISSLSDAAGYFEIGRDCEGLRAGSEIKVTLFG